jgi:hypothetical protein
MIQANELRIGNKVMDKDGWELTVSQLRSDGAFFIDEHYLTYDNIYAAPVLAQTLLDFGFKKHLDKGSPYYFLNELRYNIETDSITVLRLCDKAGESQLVVPKRKRNYCP